MLGCAFIFCYMNLFLKKDITSKEHMLKEKFTKKKKLFNPFQASAPLLHPLKTSENFWLSDALNAFSISATMLIMN